MSKPEPPHVVYRIEFSYPAEWYDELDQNIWEVISPLNDLSTSTGMGLGFRDWEILGTLEELTPLVPLLQAVFKARNPAEFDASTIHVDLDPTTTLWDLCDKYAMDPEYFEIVFRTADMETCHYAQRAHNVSDEMWIEMCAWSMVLTGEVTYGGHGYFRLVKPGGDN